MQSKPRRNVSREERENGNGEWGMRHGNGEWEGVRDLNGMEQNGMVCYDIPTMNKYRYDLLICLFSNFIREWIDVAWMVGWMDIVVSWRWGEKGGRREKGGRTNNPSSYLISSHYSIPLW